MSLLSMGRGGSYWSSETASPFGAAGPRDIRIYGRRRASTAVGRMPFNGLGTPRFWVALGHSSRGTCGVALGGQAVGVPQLQSAREPRGPSRDPQRSPVRRPSSCRAGRLLVSERLRPRPALLTSRGNPTRNRPVVPCDLGNSTPTDQRCRSQPFAPIGVAGREPGVPVAATG